MGAGVSLEQKLAVDLGSGVGAVGLVLARVGAASSLVLLEREALLVELAEKNLAAAGARGEVVRFDVARDRLPASLRDRAELVVCNPPYFAEGSVRKQKHPLTEAARTGELLPFVGTAAPKTTLPPATGLTQIYGNVDVDTIQFGDQGGLAGTVTQGSAGYIFLGSKTRAYGSQDLDETNADGEDRFVVYYLQDTNTQTSPNMVTAAEHTLTLDGVSGSDDYKVYTLGSNGPDERNFVINVLDTGRSNDGVDELTIYGFNSDQNGSHEGTKLPVDDIFLLRLATELPHETADRPGYVAMVYGQPAPYTDTITGNEVALGGSNKVARINYDTALNGRLTIDGQGGNDAFYSDDTSVIVALQGGAGDDTFQIGQIFGEKRDTTAGLLLAQDVFPDLVPTTRGWLSPGISAPLVAEGGTGKYEFRVYSNQAELRLEGDDNNDLFIVRAFAIAAVANFDWDGDDDIDADDLLAVSLDSNGDGTINFADADTTPDDFRDDVIVRDHDGVAVPIIGLGFSVARAPDIRAGGGEDEVRYNVNAPVSVCP